MIELPVVNASDSLMKRQGTEHHTTISSANRDRCIAEIRRSRQKFQRKVPIRHCIQGIGCWRSKPSARAVIARSMGKRGPASAALPSGQSLSRPPAISQPAAITIQHLDIGQQMMAERHRLGGLQMGEARHRIPRMRRGNDRPARASRR